MTPLSLKLICDHNGVLKFNCQIFEKYLNNTSSNYYSLLFSRNIHLKLKVVVLFESLEKIS